MRTVEKLIDFKNAPYYVLIVDSGKFAIRKTKEAKMTLNKIYAARVASKDNYANYTNKRDK